MAVALATGILFGLAPALEGTRFDVNVMAELTIESSDDPFREQTLRPNVRRRRDEDADRCFVHQLSA